MPVPRVARVADDVLRSAGTTNKIRGAGAARGLPRMSEPVRPLPVLSALLVLCATLAPAAPALAQSAPPVTVATAELAPVTRTLRMTGTVTSERSAALSPRVSGLVAKVHVDAGDRVAAGQVLIELDAALGRLALERASAGLEEARARLAETERLYQQAAELVQRNFFPETQLHAAEAERRVAAAAVARLEAEQRQQDELVRRHDVVAPFPGVVSRRLTDAGEWVETGTPVLELVDTGRLRVDVQVPQEQYRALTTGSSAEVRLDPLPDRVLRGKVVARVPVNDPAARTFLARIEVAGADGIMAPGMSAQVVFALRGAESVVTVPRDAIVRRQDGGTRVWIVNDADSTVSEREVELVRSLQKTVEVRSGLAAGTKVVVRGNETLREGQKVRIVESAIPAARD